MPGETGTKSPTPQAETPTKKKATSSGKAALAKVSLLDGSTLDVTIDVSLITSLIDLLLIGLDFSVKPVDVIY